MRSGVIRLATEERAKLRAFEEISARKAAGSGHETTGTRCDIVLEDTPEPVVKQEPKTEIVLDDTPKSVALSSSTETANQPGPCPQNGSITSRQMVLKISAADKSDWEFACEAAGRSGAVSAEIILSFRYFTLWCSGLKTRAWC